MQIVFKRSKLVKVRVSTVPTRKTRFFTAHFTKLAVTPMVFEIPKRNVPHLKDLKQGFRFQLKTFRKLQG